MDDNDSKNIFYWANAGDKWLIGIFDRLPLEFLCFMQFHENMTKVVNEKLFIDNYYKISVYFMQF